jgi:hypothetical protein
MSDITREEVIENLEYQNEKFFGGQSEALKMAISALSENKGDLISRQAIEEIKSEIPKIHELFDIAYEYNKEDSTRTELSQKCTTYLLDVWQTLGAIVDNFPSVEKQGEWIKTKDQYETYHFTCSKCGNDIATKSDAWNDNFCSECGADMRGET